MTTHPDLKWFENANFGLFVHWGIASVHGNIDLSWGMIENTPSNAKAIPPEEYWSLAEQFDPEAYDPDRWLRAAREAGMEYAVLTTRHHDGFALWPSEYGEFSTNQYLGGRDLVGEFVDACRRQGLRVGFYYSGPDWHHPAYPTDPCEFTQLVGSSNDVSAADPSAVADFEEYYRYAKGQIRELVTRYGEIDIFWFDGGVTYDPFEHGMGELHDMIRSAQPGIVINDRGGLSLGDYQTPENDLPEQPMSGAWELCQTWGTSWGYREEDEYDDIDWTLDRLAKTVSRGGNLLLNVGPKASGELPEDAYARLNDLAEWMSANRPAIAGADRGPWPPRANVPVTQNGTTWYLHVLSDWDGTVVVEHVPKPRSVQNLETGEKVDYEFVPGEARIKITHEPTSSPNEVIAITWDDPSLVDGDRLLNRPE